MNEGFAALSGHYAQSRHVNRHRATYKLALAVRHNDLGRDKLVVRFSKRKELTGVSVIPEVDPPALSARWDPAHRAGQRRMAPQGGGAGVCEEEGGSSSTSQQPSRHG